MNPIDSRRFEAESVESAAKRYKTLGFSLIPLVGARNPQYPKLPAIKWARFQHTIPADEDLYNWFHHQPDAGIGIVCGRISRLMVVDFDDEATASEFRRLHPDLLNTFIVKSGTRGLPHYYYRLPEGKVVPTSAYSGADLRGEGSYVVAPPTAVGDRVWEVENAAPICEISESGLRRVMRFLSALKSPDVFIEAAPDNSNVMNASEFRRLPCDTDLLAYYQQLAVMGRNQALFKTAVMARDAGKSEAALCLLMAPVHASQSGPDREDYQSRYHEAISTIASAYSHPTRRNSDASLNRLANSAREWLLENNLSYVARVLDGLYLAGFEPGIDFTEREACEKLVSLKIGRRSVSSALRALINEMAVFPAVDAPRYPPNSANAANGSESLKNSCEMSRGANRVKNIGRGRPAKYFRLPTPQAVANLLGIQFSSGDVLVAEDFAHPKTYRLALHRQLIERRPGHYARAWLGRRLGVSRWTTRRYEKVAHIQVQPTFVAQTVTWTSASKLPTTTDELPFGTFLETGGGRRYPAVRGLAFKLLKQGCQPRLMRQQANCFGEIPQAVGIPTRWQNQSNLSLVSHEKCQKQSHTPVMGSAHISHTHDHEQGPASLSTTAPSTPSVGIPTPPRPEPQFWLCTECLDFHVTAQHPGTCERCGSENSWEILSPTIWRNPQALKSWWQQRYKTHQQLKNALVTFKQLKLEWSPGLKRLVENIRVHAPTVSWSNARMLIEKFGQQLVEKALDVLRTRTGLRSPAGFLIAFLRSESKLLSRNNKNKSRQPNQPKGETALDWMRRMAKSPYLSFISNADDIVNFEEIPLASPV